MAYYRAYELIEGRQYERERFKKKYQTIQAAEVKKKIDCDNCKELSNCAKTGNYCPDMLAFIDQDHVKLRERNTLH